MKIKILVLLLIILSIVQHVYSTIDEEEVNAALKSINRYVGNLEFHQEFGTTQEVNKLVSEEGIGGLLSSPLAWANLKHDFFDGKSQDHSKLRLAYHSALFEGARVRASDVLNRIQKMASAVRFKRSLRNILPGFRNVVNFMEEQLKYAKYYYQSSFKYPEFLAELHVVSNGNDEVLRKFKIELLDYELYSLQPNRGPYGKDTIAMIANPQEFAKLELMNGLFSPNIFFGPLTNFEPRTLPHDFLKLAVAYHNFMHKALLYQIRFAENSDKLMTLLNEHNRYKEVASSAMDFVQALALISKVDTTGKHNPNDKCAQQQPALDSADKSQQHPTHLHSERADRKRKRVEGSHERVYSGTDGIGQAGNTWGPGPATPLEPREKRFKVTRETLAGTSISAITSDALLAEHSLIYADENKKKNKVSQQCCGTGPIGDNPIVNVNSENSHHMSSANIRVQLQDSEIQVIKHDSFFHPTLERVDPSSSKVATQQPVPSNIRLFGQTVWVDSNGKHEAHKQNLPPNEIVQTDHLATVMDKTLIDFSPRLLDKSSQLEADISTGKYEGEIKNQNKNAVSMSHSGTSHSHKDVLFGLSQSNRADHGINDIVQSADSSNKKLRCSF